MVVMVATHVFLLVAVVAKLGDVVESFSSPVFVPHRPLIQQQQQQHSRIHTFDRSIIRLESTTTADDTATATTIADTSSPSVSQSSDGGLDILIEKEEEEEEEEETEDSLSVEESMTTAAQPIELDENNDTLVEEDEKEIDPFMSELELLETTEVKRRLLDLVPKMMGTPDEFQLVEGYVNTLEQRYTSIQTLSFLNMAMEGEWQLLFSTNFIKSGGGPKRYFRLRELCQNIQTNNLNGTIVNVATWDLANNYDDDDNSSSMTEQQQQQPPRTPIFDSSGTFSVKCSYSINQGARKVVNMDEHVLELAKGSTVPNDIEQLIGQLHRSIPKELFDPDDHAIDTTYLDADLRIVRMTGPRLEGVRDIFIRRGSVEINPV